MHLLRTLAGAVLSYMSSAILCFYYALWSAISEFCINSEILVNTVQQELSNRSLEQLQVPRWEWSSFDLAVVGEPQALLPVWALLGGRPMSAPQP